MYLKKIRFLKSITTIKSRIFVFLCYIHVYISPTVKPHEQGLNATEEDWNKTMSVNVAGYSHMAQACYEEMKKISLKENCSILNTSSISAHQAQPVRYDVQLHESLAKFRQPHNRRYITIPTFMSREFEGFLVCIKFEISCSQPFRSG